jgi:hypothetical protein
MSSNFGQVLHTVFVMLPYSPSHQDYASLHQMRMIAFFFHDREDEGFV